MTSSFNYSDDIAGLKDDAEAAEPSSAQCSKTLDPADGAFPQLVSENTYTTDCNEDDFRSATPTSQFHIKTSSIEFKSNNSTARFCYKSSELDVDLKNVTASFLKDELKLSNQPSHLKDSHGILHYAIGDLFENLTSNNIYEIVVKEIYEPPEAVGHNSVIVENQLELQIPMQKQTMEIALPTSAIDEFKKEMTNGITDFTGTGGLASEPQAAILLSLVTLLPVLSPDTPLNVNNDKVKHIIPCSLTASLYNISNCLENAFNEASRSMLSIRRATEDTPSKIMDCMTAICIAINELILSIMQTQCKNNSLLSQQKNEQQRLHEKKKFMEKIEQRQDKWLQEQTKIMIDALKKYQTISEKSTTTSHRCLNLILDGLSNFGEHHFLVLYAFIGSPDGVAAAIAAAASNTASNLLRRDNDTSNSVLKNFMHEFTKLIEFPLLEDLPEKKDNIIEALSTIMIFMGEVEPLESFAKKFIDKLNSVVNEEVYNQLKELHNQLKKVASDIFISKSTAESKNKTKKTNNEIDQENMKHLQENYHYKLSRNDKLKEKLNETIKEIANLTAEVRVTEVEELKLEEVIKYLEQIVKILHQLHCTWKNIEQFFEEMKDSAMEIFTTSVGEFSDSSSLLLEKEEELESFTFRMLSHAVKSIVVCIKITYCAKLYINLSNKCIISFLKSAYGSLTMIAPGKEQMKLIANKLDDIGKEIKETIEEENKKMIDDAHQKLDKLTKPIQVKSSCIQ